MFNIGDKIVYPMQGAGEIKLIEEKEFHGVMQTYYDIALVNNGMKLMLPSTKMDNSNARLISNPAKFDDILFNLDKYQTDLDSISKNSKERIEINNEKIKSGSLEQLTEVIVNLSLMKKQHPLNSSENQIFLKAKRLFIDEMCLAKNISKREADNILDEKLNLA